MVGTARHASSHCRHLEVVSIGNQSVVQLIVCLFGVTEAVGEVHRVPGRNIVYAVTLSNMVDQRRLTLNRATCV